MKNTKNAKSNVKGHFQLAIYEKLKRMYLKLRKNTVNPNRMLHKTKEIKKSLNRNYPYMNFRSKYSKLCSEDQNTPIPILQHTTLVDFDSDMKIFTVISPISAPSGNIIETKEYRNGYLNIISPNCNTNSPGDCDTPMSNIGNKGENMSKQITKNSCQSMQGLLLNSLDSCSLHYSAITGNMNNLRWDEKKRRLTYANGKDIELCTSDNYQYNGNKDLE